MQLVLLPYYALKQVKPDEEESKGGYRLKEVKEARSEETNQDFTKTENPYCPQCGSTWTGAEKRSTTIIVTMPQAINSGTG